MGQQQMLLIILGVILVGIAISVGISLFSAHSFEANKDGVMSRLQDIGAHAYQYKIRPSTLGGGSNKYDGYQVPAKMNSDDNGFSYATGTVSSTSCEIIGISRINTAWTATAVLDDTGHAVITFIGW